ncbi:MULTISPECIES: PAS domain S-box protein [Aminobacterium]|jgi:PAS domain S-box-containing protein|uniref:PAS domain-containing sensor histidine kinase n=1 Tax=Aminobacterium TaxID=81466 RepID=UPI00257EB412|nr:PAS domain S-box protein [Aminobacterium sp. UBA4987]
MKENKWEEREYARSCRQISLPFEDGLSFLERKDDSMFQDFSIWFNVSLDHPDLLLSLIDEDGCLRFWNSTAERISGYSSDSLLGSRKWLSLLYPDSEYRQRMLSSLRMIALVKGASVTVETKIQGKDSRFHTILWVCSNMTPMLENHLSGVVCLGVDITARWEREKSLTERVATMSALFDNMADGVFLHEVDEDGCPGPFIEVNEGACRMLGVKREDLLAMSPISIDAQIQREEMPSVVIDIFRKGHHTFQTLLKKRSGDIVPVEIHSHLFSFQGKPYILSIARDDSERRKNEEVLLENHKFSSSILDKSPNAVFVIGPDTRIQYVNESFVRQFGFQTEEIVGRPAPYPWWRSDYWINMGELRIAMHDGIVGKEKHFIRKDGEEIWGEITAVPIREEDSRLRFCVLTWKDLTTYKKLQEELRLNQHQLQYLSSELYVAEERERRRISTDLHDSVGQNLALSRIKLEMLKKRTKGRDHQGAIDDVLSLINRSIQEMRTLIFELSPPMLFELSFHAAVEWLVEKMEEEHGLCILFKDLLMSDEIPMDIKIFLFRALRELVMNIIKHANTTEAVVTLSRFDPWTITLEVKDNGVGFDLSSLRELGRDPSNFGLLSIRERVNYLGGFMQIQTLPGEGTKISLFVPVEGEEERSSEIDEKSQDSAC